MQRHTHIIFAILLFIVFSIYYNFPLFYGIFAIIGTLIPDIDIKIKGLHRKLFHNVWFLGLVLITGFYFSLINYIIAIIFSIGFISHLISDSLTHMGIMPFWPIEKPKFRGPMKTGSKEEFVLMIIMLFVIFWVGGFI